MKSIEERINELEKSIRHYRVMVLILILFLAVGIWAGPFLANAKAGKDIEKVIRTQRLEIVNTQGKPQAVMMVPENNELIFSIFNIKGKPLIALYIKKDEPRMDLFDAQGNTRTALGTAMLGLYDDQGKTRAVFSLNQEINGPVLSFLDSQEKPIIFLSANEKGPSLNLYNVRGRATLFASNNGPGLGLYNAKNEPQAGLVLKEGGPNFSLFDDKGKTLFEKP